MPVPSDNAERKIRSDQNDIDNSGWQHRTGAGEEIV